MPQPRHATYKASLAQAVAFGIVDKVVDALRPLATQRDHTALRRDLLANFPQTHVELLGRLPSRRHGRLVQQHILEITWLPSRVVTTPCFHTCMATRAHVTGDTCF